MAGSPRERRQPARWARRGPSCSRRPDVARGASRSGESRDGVALSSLDDPLFAGSGVVKRALIDYLDAISERILPELRDRPLSVIRATGDEPFMQKNVPKYTPDWVQTV